MIETYKYKSKTANAIVFLAGLITYIGKDMLAQILPASYAYLAPIIVLVAGYLVVQNTEDIRVDVAEQKIHEQYQIDVTPANTNTPDMAGETYDN